MLRRRVFSPRSGPRFAARAITVPEEKTPAPLSAPELQDGYSVAICNQSAVPLADPIGRKEALRNTKDGEERERERRSDQHHRILPAAAGDADRGGDPDVRGRGHVAHRAPANEDQP